MRLKIELYHIAQAASSRASNVQVCIFEEGYRPVWVLISQEIMKCAQHFTGIYRRRSPFKRPCPSSPLIHTHQVSVLAQFSTSDQRLGHVLFAPTRNSPCSRGYKPNSTKEGMQLARLRPRSGK